MPRNVRKHNLVQVREMFEQIAERSGEDRATVFLDLLVHSVLEIKDFYEQQAVIKSFALVYSVEPAVLLNPKPEEEVPF